MTPSTYVELSDGFALKQPYKIQIVLKLLKLLVLLSFRTPEKVYTLEFIWK